MADREFYAYIHRIPCTGAPFYVGKGSGDRAWQTRGRNRHWHAVVRKHGGFTVEIVQDGLQEWAAFEIETGLIALYGRDDLGLGPLVNKADGGEGASGSSFSAEARSQISVRQRGDRNVSKRDDVRAKISLAMSGDANPVRIASVRERISATLTGKTHSDETRRKMSDSHKGKVFSQETRDRISAARQGEKHPLFGKTLSPDYKKKISEALKASLARKRAAKAQSSV